MFTVVPFVAPTYPKDGTLWVFNGIDSLEQYSQTGVLLSTFALPGSVTYDGIVGGEFAVNPVPIPGALLLFAPGLAGLGIMRRRAFG